MPGKPSRPFGPVQTPVTVETLRAVLAPPVHSPSTCQPAAPSVKKLPSFFTACRTSVVSVVTAHHGINYGSVYFPNSAYSIALALAENNYGAMCVYVQCAL